MNKLYFFLFFLLSIAFIPSFGAIDKGSTIWLYLSLGTIIFLFSPLDLSFLKNHIFRLYFLFILQVLLSLLYTNNFSISIVDLSRHLVVFISVILLLSLLKRNNFTFSTISLIISFYLIYESLYSLRPLYYFILNNGFNFSIITSLDVDALKGLLGNRNITTASIVIKIPFLIYLIYRSKLPFKVFYSFLAFLPFLVLFLINSRAALLSFIFIIVLSLLSIIFFHRNKLSIVFILLPLISSFYFSSLLIPDSSANATSKLASINISNESSSYRFFLWENAFDFIASNPFIGCGIGNWKVESAVYWNSFGKQYLVPYHAHNDFLEFSTELGIIGGLTYLLLFILLLYSAFRNYFKTIDFKFLILFLSFSALFVDSLLNFPFERPFIQVIFIVLLSLIIHYDYSKKIQ